MLGKSPEQYVSKPRYFGGGRGVTIDPLEWSPLVFYWPIRILAC